MNKHLESALAKLRECANSTMFVEVNHNEAAALLAKIGDADRLCRAAEDARLYVDGWKKHRPGWNGNWFDVKRELEEAVADFRNPQRPGAGGGEKSGEFAPAPPDKTYQHALVRRLWEAQLGDLPDDVKRLMAEAATEIEGNLPATDDFVNAMRRKHAKVLR